MSATSAPVRNRLDGGGQLRDHALHGVEHVGVGHVASIGPRGEPQSSPVWVDWDGTHIRFSNLTTRQKYKNLSSDSRVALSATHPDNAYRYLEVRGRVVAIEPDPDGEFIDSIAAKYQGKIRFEGHREPQTRCTIVVEPLHATTMGGAPD